MEALKTNRKTAFFTGASEKCEFLTHTPNPFQQPDRRSSGSTASPQILPLSPTPGASESDLIWRQSPHRADEVRMRSVGWAPAPGDPCAHREGNLETRAGCFSNTAGRPRLAGDHQKLGRRAGALSLRRAQPAHAWPPTPTPHRDRTSLRRPLSAEVDVGPGQLWSEP